MGQSKFIHLHWALDRHPKNLMGSLLAAYQDNPGYLSYLDGLLGFLKERGCRGIREKLSDVPDLSVKFRAVRSELEVAKALLHAGKSVIFLPDKYMDERSSPDLFVTDKHIEAYVEVKCVTQDPVTDMLLDSLREFLNAHSYPYRVDLTLNEGMSIPTTKWWERDLKERLADKALQEFMAKITTVTGPFPTEIKTNAVIFEIHQSASGKGYPGILSTSLVEIPVDKQVEKIRRDICEKAKKREKWTGDERTKIYIVALDFENMTYGEDCVGDALIGSRVTVALPLPLPNTPETGEVKSARKKGWEDFMRGECILTHNRTFLDPCRKGIFFTEPITKNVSGVIGKFRDTLHFAPNPFASDEINDPQLANYIK